MADRTRMTLPALGAKVARGEPITWLTCYDYPTAVMQDAARVEGIAKCGIPVMGHLGLTPQSAGSMGGFRLQGKDAARAKRIVDDARVLEEAGAFSIILELVPDRLAALVTERSRGAIIMGL